MTALLEYMVFTHQHIQKWLASCVCCIRVFKIYYHSISVLMLLRILASVHLFSPQVHLFLFLVYSTPLNSWFVTQLLLFLGLFISIPSY